MLIAAVVALPIGIADAAPAFADPVVLVAAAGVGFCSSVIPYVSDQLAMARLPRATYALMVSLLPATATVIGVVVLTQIPNAKEILGVVLVVAGVAIHGERATPRGRVLWHGGVLRSRRTRHRDGRRGGTIGRSRGLRADSPDEERALMARYGM